MKISDRASQVERVQGVQQKSQIVKKLPLSKNFCDTIIKKANIEVYS